MDNDKLDISDQAEWLKQIKLTSLSNLALTQASKLAHKIRKINGQVVRLQDPSMAFELAKQVVAINDSELNTLYRLFLEDALRINDANYPAKTKGSYRGVKTER